MLILGIETSTRLGSVALRDEEGQTRCLALPDEGRRHAQTIVSTVDRLFRDAGRDVSDCDGIAVSVGPGSFTGLRVGVVFAKTMAWWRKCPLMGIPTSEVLAAALPPRGGLWTLIDAQRGDLFATRFRADPVAGRWDEDLPTRVLPLADLAAEVEKSDCLTGPALSRYASSLQEAGRMSDPSCWTPSAAHVADLAASRVAAGKFDDCFQLRPSYLRRSSAEDAWERRQQAQGQGEG